MKKYINPNIEVWTELATRPEMKKEVLNQQVEEILKEVKNKGDEALFNFSKKFDGVNLISLEASKQELEESINNVSQELQKH